VGPDGNSLIGTASTIAGSSTLASEQTPTIVPATRDTKIVRSLASPGCVNRSRVPALRSSDVSTTVGHPATHRRTPRGSCVRASGGTISRWTDAATRVGGRPRASLVVVDLGQLGLSRVANAMRRGVAAHQAHCGPGVPVVRWCPRFRVGEQTRGGGPTRRHTACRTVGAGRWSTVCGQREPGGDGSVGTSPIRPGEDHHARDLCGGSDDDLV